jgi:hypothetical protein
MPSQIFKIGKKTIGEYNHATNIFWKKVLRSKHLMRALMAWGIDEATLSKLPSDCKIVIDEGEERIRYTCYKSDYDEYGEYLHFKEPRRDHKTQKFLHIEYFKTEKL